MLLFAILTNLIDSNKVNYCTRKRYRADELKKKATKLCRSLVTVRNRRWRNSGTPCARWVARKDWNSLHGTWAWTKVENIGVRSIYGTVWQYPQIVDKSRLAFIQSRPRERRTLVTGEKERERERNSRRDRNKRGIIHCVSIIVCLAQLGKSYVGSSK